MGGYIVLDKKFVSHVTERIATGNFGIYNYEGAYNIVKEALDTKKPIIFDSALSVGYLTFYNVIYRDPENDYNPVNAIVAKFIVPDYSLDNLVVTLFLLEDSRDIYYLRIEPISQ